MLLARPWRWRRLTPAVGHRRADATLASLAVDLEHPALHGAIRAAADRCRRRGTAARSTCWAGGELAGFRFGAGAGGAAGRRCSPSPPCNYATDAATAAGAIERAAIVEQLDETPDRHLVLVRYGADHNPPRRVGLQRAPTSTAPKIVWARAMDPASDAELLRYFGDRQAWLLEPEARRLVPLPRDAASPHRRTRTRSWRLAERAIATSRNYAARQRATNAA